jgi:hypothetical protein
MQNVYLFSRGSNYEKKNESLHSNFESTTIYHNDEKRNKYRRRFLMILKNKLPVVLVLVLLSLSIIHFKNDIVLSNGDAYVWSSDSDIIDGNSIKSELRLVRDAPYFQGNISKLMEYMFWSSTSLKEVRMYKIRNFSFYRETEFLNQKFEEGKEYSPVFDPMNNVMDWRNHLEDRLGDVMFCKREDGSVCYYVKTYSSALGIRCLVDITSRQKKVQTYNSFDELFDCKCREFNILKQ